MPFIPYADIIVCFVGSCRSLSHSISLTPLKKRIVLAPLFFVVFFELNHSNSPLANLYFSALQ